MVGLKISLVSVPRLITGLSVEYDFENVYAHGLGALRRFGP